VWCRTGGRALALRCVRSPSENIMCFSVVLGYGVWPLPWGGGWMRWMVGVSDASSISIGRILSPVMWFGHVWDNHFCQILSVNGAFPSLVICAMPTPVKTTPELSEPAFGVLPKTGIASWVRSLPPAVRKSAVSILPQP